MAETINDPAQVFSEIQRLADLVSQRTVDLKEVYRKGELFSSHVYGIKVVCEHLRSKARSCDCLISRKEA